MTRAGGELEAQRDLVQKAEHVPHGLLVGSRPSAEFGDVVQPGPLVDFGEGVFGSDQELLSVDPTGTVRWSCPLPFRISNCWMFHGAKLPSSPMTSLTFSHIWKRSSLTTMR